MPTFIRFRGIRDVPALRWKKGIAEWPPTLPLKGEFLDVALGYTEERIVSARGIELDNLFYNDDDLAMLRRHVKPRKKVIIKRNPSDLSLIHVYDEKHDQYLPVPAIDQEYTKGLTLYQHTIISRYVREQMKRNVDVVALCRAKGEIQDMVEREWVKAGRAKRTRGRLARFRNEGVQTNREGIERSSERDTLTLPGRRRPPLLLDPASGTVTAGNTPGHVDAVIVREGETAEVAVKANGNGSKAIAGQGADGGNKSEAPKKTARANSSSTAGLAKPQTGTEGEDNLDMTGWSGDYDLPKLEVKR